MDGHVAPGIGEYNIVAGVPLMLKQIQLRLGPVDAITGTRIGRYLKTEIVGALYSRAVIQPEHRIVLQYRGIGALYCFPCRIVKRQSHAAIYWFMQHQSTIPHAVYQPVICEQFPAASQIPDAAIEGRLRLNEWVKQHQGNKEGTSGG